MKYYTISKTKILIILLLLLILPLTSCKKGDFKNNQNYPTLNYYIAGLYLNAIEINEIEVADNNPKVYIDYLQNHLFKTDAGMTDYRINFTDNSKTINEDDGITKITLIVNVSFPQKYIDDHGNKIQLYVIRQNYEGTYFINQKESKMINIEKDTFYTLKTTFTYQNKKYDYSLSLKWNIK